MISKGSVGLEKEAQGGAGEKAARSSPAVAWGGKNAPAELSCRSRPELVGQGGKAGGRMCTEGMGTVASVGANSPASVCVAHLSGQRCRGT